MVVTSKQIVVKCMRSRGAATCSSPFQPPGKVVPGTWVAVSRGRISSEERASNLLQRPVAPLMGSGGKRPVSLGSNSPGCADGTVQEPC